jgi:hypothetical protein
MDGDGDNGGAGGGGDARDGVRDGVREVRWDEDERDAMRSRIILFGAVLVVLLCVLLAVTMFQLAGVDTTQ